LNILILFKVEAGLVHAIISHRALIISTEMAPGFLTKIQ
jgi:hypothetical protein